MPMPVPMSAKIPQSLLLSLLLCAAALLAACSQPGPVGAPPSDSATDVPAANATNGDSPDGDSEPQPVVTWYYYDQDNTDPEANERVGNAYLARAIPQFNADHAGQYTWVNVPRDYNLSLDLVTAVQNNGEIPDVMRMSINNMPTFIRNNTVQDLTDFVMNSEWAADLNPTALEACRGPDGDIYCIPLSASPYVVFYWTDYFPNGFPTTPAALLEAAADLQDEDIYALTYWGSTALDGEGTGRYYYQVIRSFGGSYDDGAGNMQLDTPENIAAIEFMRAIVAGGYSPEAVFMGNFEEEDAFKRSLAAAFPTGYFSAYLYLNPLTAPDGTEYATVSSQDMEAAVDAGDIAIAPFVAPPDQMPGCHTDYFGFVIPNGAPNRDGAEAYINWIMEPANQIEWVLQAGGGAPVSQALRTQEAFQTPFFQQGLAAAERSDCAPWFGSLLRIPEAKRIISNVFFDLVRGDATQDIAQALQRAEDEYNALP
ncbi:MAG: extracellular solute-binding protein [Litorilinea sp.]